MKEKLLALLKSCLTSSGSIRKSVKGKGVNLYNLKADFKINDFNDELKALDLGLVASHFPEESIAPEKEDGDWTTKEESVYVGPPTSVDADSLSKIFSLSD